MGGAITGDEEGTEQQEKEADRHPPNVTFLQLLTLQPRRCAPCVYLIACGCAHRAIRTLNCNRLILHETRGGGGGGGGRVGLVHRTHARRVATPPVQVRTQLPICLRNDRLPRHRNMNAGHLPRPRQQCGLAV